MNTDAVVLALMAIADMAFLVHLRRRNGRRARMERVMASLRMAVRREIGDAPPPAKRRLPLAG